MNELKTVYKGLGMYPTQAELKAMIAEVDVNGSGSVDFSEFAAMRQSGDAVELAVLAEFVKYATDRLYKGYVTEHGLRHEMSIDGLSGQELDEAVSSYIATYDVDKDGKISYKDLWTVMMETVPPAWIEWLAVNVRRGVPDETILNLMREAGFDTDKAEDLLVSTKRDGRAQESAFQRSPALSHAHIYVVRE